jgi:hypothetical protein
MVRHIFKKDWLLLWPLVAALAVLQVLFAFARYRAGQIPNSLPGVPVSLLAMLASVLVIALVVHQDPIPGTRQDWLVRPIPRRDLLLSKLIFSILLVQGPWFVTDLLQGLANGFSVGESLTAAGTCALWVLLVVTVPVSAFAAVTASMTETIVAALGVFVLLIVPALLGVTAPTALSGFAWVPALVRETLLLAAAVGVLILQYRWRWTWAARGLFAGAVLAGILVRFLPWQTAFAIDRTLTAGSGDDGGVAVSFVPDAGRYRLAAGQGLDDVVEKPGLGAADVAAENQRRRAEGARTVFLPVRVSGLPSDARLLADRSDVTLIDRDGRTLHRGTGNDLELRSADANAAVHQGIRVPGVIYGQVSAEPLDVQIDYTFTLLRAAASYALPARDGDQRMPGIGWCSTVVNDAGTRVLFRCLQPGERPPCLVVVLEHISTGQRNPEVSMCAPDYSPYRGHILPDALSRFMGAVPFYDPSGLIRYPVGGPQLVEARVVVTDFRPTAHFIKRVVIPSVRLRNWEPQAPASASTLRRRGSLSPV